jgi:hypothetical protein
MSRILNLVSNLILNLRLNSFLNLKMNTINTLKFIIICILLFSRQEMALARAQSYGQWSGFFSNIKFSERWGWYQELQTRLQDGYEFGESPDNLRQKNNRLLIRPALVYYLDSHTQLHFGYGWTPNLSPFRDENRIYQQILWQGRFSNYDWQLRPRFEQRWIENTHETAYRARFFVRISELWPSSKGWVLWDELFWNLNDVAKGPQEGFDQNRFFVGAQFKLENSFRIEPGYMYIFINGSEVSTSLDLHLLTVFAFMNW